MSAWPASMIQAFFDRHPELNIDIVLDDENIDLLERGIDVALRMGGGLATRT
jgi:DNA-binding transcriptional LysR family regulator